MLHAKAQGPERQSICFMCGASCQSFIRTRATMTCFMVLHAKALRTRALQSIHVSCACFMPKLQGPVRTINMFHVRCFMPKLQGAEQSLPFMRAVFHQSFKDQERQSTCFMCGASCQSFKDQSDNRHVSCAVLHAKASRTRSDNRHVSCAVLHAKASSTRATIDMFHVRCFMPKLQGPRSDNRDVSCAVLHAKASRTRATIDMFHVQCFMPKLQGPERQSTCFMCGASCQSFKDQSDNRHVSCAVLHAKASRTCATIDMFHVWCFILILYPGKVYILIRILYHSPNGITCVYNGSFS